MPIRRSGLIVRDEGIMLPPVSDLDFQGAGVTVALSGSKLVATIPGGGGGSVDWAGMGIFRPEDYGTVDPTGIADSRAAFQAAIDALNATNYGGAVVCPPGRFKIGSPGLTFWSHTYDRSGGWAYAYGKALIGAGRGATVLIADKTMTEPVLTVTTRKASTPSTAGVGVPGTYIRDITFSSVNWWDSTSTFNGNIGYSNIGLTDGVLKVQESSYAVIERVTVDCYTSDPSSFPVYYPPLGMHVVDSLCMVYRDIHVNNARTGLKFTTASGFSCQDTAIYNGVFFGCQDWCIDFQGGGNLLLIEGLDTETSIGGGVRYSGGAGYVELRGPMYWEGIATMTHLDVNATLAKVTGPFSGWGGGVIQNRGSTQLLIEDFGAGSAGGGVDVSVVNASGASVQKVRSSGVSVTGGSSSTWH